MRKLFEEPKVEIYSFVTEGIMALSSPTEEDYESGQGGLELPAV